MKDGVLLLDEKIKSIFNKHMHIETQKIEIINKGVTNRTFLVTTNENKYILRIAGEGTNEYINRFDEISNMKKAMTLDILPEIFYASENTGTIISQYISNSYEFTKKDLYDQSKLTLLNKALINLHASNVQFNNEFDIEKSMNEYQSLLKKMNCPYPAILKNNLSILDKAFQKLKENYVKNLVPCHIDPKLNNFLITDDQLYLIDWEYSGMADEYFEMANFTLTNELSKEEEKLFLDNYIQLSNMDFNKEKYILYKIATDYLWLFWHLIKLNQNQNIEYNQRKWQERLFRALENIKCLEG